MGEGHGWFIGIKAGIAPSCLQVLNAQHVDRSDHIGVEVLPQNSLMISLYSSTAF
jgi:hypothetical protein